MVKADLTRDYYGDLELQPGASESDIKKQFRALGIGSTRSDVFDRTFANVLPPQL
jgi:hypothetical protein